MEKRSESMPVGVRYYKTNGMTYGENRDIALTQGQTTAEQWEEIADALTRLLPSLKALREEEAGRTQPSFLRRLFPKEEPEELDGPNETIFTVTWRNADGSEEEIRYEIPQGEAFSQLLLCMQAIIAESTEETECGEE